MVVQSKPAEVCRWRSAAVRPVIGAQRCAFFRLSPTLSTVPDKPVRSLARSTEGEDRALLRKFRGLACDVLADAEALGPGRALEWVAALETATVHYSALPPARKRRFNLTMRDTGIDALAVDGLLAVQAKDYNGTVPLQRLANFYFCAKVRSRLPSTVELLVATTSRTRLAPTWVETGVAQHRRIPRARFERRIAAARRLRRLKQLQGSAASAWHDRDVQLWPHQEECLEKCIEFYRESARRDFFAEVATAAGKTGIYAELLKRLRPRKACIVVPRVDLMEDFWRLYRPDAVRVGTGHNGDGNGVDSDAELFVCVRDSAWRLGNLTFDLVIFDEAHHYEPPPQDIDAELEKLWMIGHRGAVLSLKACKRFFFSATLRYHHLSPDFRFTLREAIGAGRVADYDITVPIVSEGDAKPCLARLLQQSPHFRRILAFCNTEREADRFAALLRDDGVPAELYSGRTSKAERQRLDADFASGELRALVTCRVLGEGRDVPSADTCVFVEPRSSRVDVAQCIGRVLRLPGKTVAHVVAPAHSQKSVFELWFAALMEADPLVAADVRECPAARVGVVDCRLPWHVGKAEASEDAALAPTVERQEDREAAEAELLAAPVFEQLRRLTPEAVAALRASSGGLSGPMARPVAARGSSVGRAKPGTPARLAREEKVQEYLEAMKGRARPIPRSSELVFSDNASMGYFWGDCKKLKRCETAPYDRLLQNDALRRDYHSEGKLSMEEKVKELLEAMQGRAIPIPQRSELVFSDNVSMGRFWFNCKSPKKCERAPYDRLLQNDALRKDYHSEGRMSVEEKVQEFWEVMHGRDAPIPKASELRFSDNADMGMWWHNCKKRKLCAKVPYDQLLQNDVLNRSYHAPRKLPPEDKVQEFMEAMEVRELPIQQGSELAFSDGCSMGTWWNDCKSSKRCEKAPYDELLQNSILRTAYHSKRRRDSEIRKVK